MLNSLYPSIYKIVYPIIQRIIAGNNYQIINEKQVNNIVDTTLDIVCQDIDNLEKGKNLNIDSEENKNNETSSSVGNNSLNNKSSNASNNINNAMQTSSGMQNKATSNVEESRVKQTSCTTNNPLMRDLIKILVIKELISKNNIRRFGMRM